MQDQNSIEIFYPKNKSTIIDLKDLDIYFGKGWFIDNTNGYLRRKKMGGGFLEFHRVIMKASDNDLIDHINRNRADNRRCNLRFTTPIFNQLNCVKARSDKKHKAPRGIYWCNTGQCWKINFSFDGVRKRFGVFKTPEEALEARIKLVNEKCKDKSPYWKHNN